ncbi:hypothetical protein PGT21_007314 [Puccinia graminis f. sp. tritici]|uniref:Hydrophobin n=1 Tax=Puccinia graminis f. sp. tritici TaxID=56615 RepID=A0A5B0LKX0_PUCGR|nr:hypothetical protein PGT21_007314 [Puccinia graminis f. sp. tritici]
MLSSYFFPIVMVLLIQSQGPSLVQAFGCGNISSGSGIYYPHAGCARLLPDKTPLEENGPPKYWHVETISAPVNPRSHTADCSITAHRIGICCTHELLRPEDIIIPTWLDDCVYSNGNTIPKDQE